jgi:hypothetical protein
MIRMSFQSDPRGLVCLRRPREKSRLASEINNLLQFLLFYRFLPAQVPLNRKNAGLRFWLI